jgi:hypothetical protein
MGKKNNSCTVLTLSSILSNNDLKTTFSTEYDDSEKCTTSILKTDSESKKKMRNMKSDKSDKSVKSDKSDKSEKSEKSERCTEKTETEKENSEMEESRTIVEKMEGESWMSEEMGIKEYEEVNERKCEKIIEKYKKYHEMIKANNDIIVMLEFLGSKLRVVEVNVNEREFMKYSIRENIIWIENYIDKLFCIIRKNEAYKSISVKDYKLKNDESRISDRIYYIKIGYMEKGKKIIKNITLKFEWIQLTNNSSKSFMAIINKIIKEIEKEVARIRSLNILPFME